MSATQRMMYFATMWSYLSGFAALAYIAAPIIFLTLGILPVNSLGEDFFLRLIPFLIANQLLFLVVGWGVKTWRGQQYSLALFPIWIRAVTTAIGNVWFGQSLGFVVTPKTRETGKHRPPWELIKPQLWAMGLLVGAVVIGLVRFFVGQAPALGTFVNIAWVVYDLVILSVIIQAARYAGPEPADEETPV
jgi:cellulose synthase (UDP-forming)